MGRRWKNHILSSKLFLLIGLVAKWERIKLFLPKHDGLITTFFDGIYTVVGGNALTILHFRFKYIFTFIDNSSRYR